MYLLIENQGELDINALSLMGGTTKRGDKSKLGNFGSGNKYSLALLLNEGIEFHIFSGNREVIVSTEECQFRDTTLNKILIDGNPTSLTTQMGPDWVKPWFAVREFVQNSIDEGASNIVPNSSEPRGIIGKTRIYIKQTPEIQEVITNWNNYFSFDRLDQLCSVGSVGEIFPNSTTDETLVVYKKGIKCSVDDRKSLFHYNFLDVEINESRVVKDNYTVYSNICKALCACTDMKTIKTLLSNLKSTHDEYKCFFYTSYQLSDEWNTAIGNHKIVVAELSGWFLEEQQRFDCFVLPNDLCRKIQTKFPHITIFGLTKPGEDFIGTKAVVLDKRQEFILKQCEEFLKEAEYQVDYPIEVVEFSNPDTLGLARNSTIYISIKQFLRGKKEIVATIIEENEHLKTGYSDESRSFQSHFINLYLSEMEHRIGNFL